MSRKHHTKVRVIQQIIITNNNKQWAQTIQLTTITYLQEKAHVS